MMNCDMELLLVEGDPKDVRLTIRQLESENLTNRIVVARDGEEAAAARPIPAGGGATRFEVPKDRWHVGSSEDEGQ